MQLGRRPFAALGRRVFGSFDMRKKLAERARGSRESQGYVLCWGAPRMQGQIQDVVSDGISFLPDCLIVNRRNRDPAGAVGCSSGADPRKAALLPATGVKASK